MKLNSLTPNLMVEDVNSTVDFFRQVLGFQLIVSVPEAGQFNWAMVRRDEVELMFQSVESLCEEIPAFVGKPVGATLTFYMQVENLDDFFEKVKAAGATVSTEIHTTFYGAREFFLTDPNGYVFTFSEKV